MARRRVYRDERGRFISREQYHSRRGRFTREEETILDDVRRSMRGKGPQARGVEYELTATTKGGTPRRVPGQKGKRTTTLDPRKLHLKIRVVADRQMEMETVRLLLDRAAKTGEIPPGVQIHVIDWIKGENEGEVEEELKRQALRGFYRAIRHDNTRTRFERVDRRGERA